MATALPDPCDESRQTHNEPAQKCAHKTAVLAATILGSSLAFVMGSIVNVALPAMQAEFDADAAGAQWIINAYLLPVGALVLMGGALGDHYGRKKMFQSGLVLFILATLGSALAPDMTLLLTCRALQGVGAAMLAPNSLAIIAASFAGQERGKAIGTWAAAGAMAGAVAPVIGGWVVDIANWRWAFAVIMPVGLLAFGLGQYAIAESVEDEDDRAPLDWTGAALITTGLGALVWSLTALPQQDTGSITIWIGMAVAVTAVAMFLSVEKRKGDAAMTPLKLFSTSSFAGISLLTLLLYAALGGLLVLLPYMLINAAGYSATNAGLAILPFPLTMAILSRYAGGLAHKIGLRQVLAIGPALVAMGFFYFMRLDGGGISYWVDIFPALITIALGMTASVAPLTNAVMESVDDAHVGVASGINNAIARGAGLIATALLGFVLVNEGQGPAALISGFSSASLVGAILALCGSLASFLLIKVELKEEKPA